MKKKIAIQGHPARGAEVIKALELMGFKNTYGLEGEVAEYFYCSGINDSIDAKVFDELEDNYTPMTLETYLKSLPKAEIAERLVLPCGKESMEVRIPDDCELVQEDGKWVLRKREAVAWVAREKDGSLWAFAEKPTYHSNLKHAEDDCWRGGEFMMLHDGYFPEVTFENSPKRVKLTLKED